MSAQSQHIYVVDDEASARELVGDYFTLHGFTVTLCEGGARLRKELAHKIPDLIVLDLNMPKMDGREFVRHLRTMPDMDRVPVLMVTTHAERNDVVLALQAGVNDYVVKPFTPELLQEKIASLAVKVRA